MEKVTVYIENDELFVRETAFVLNMLADACGIAVLQSASPENAQITIGSSAGMKIRINRNFFEKLDRNIFHHREHFENQPMILLGSEPDYISSIFYLVNSIQEYDTNERDNLGRFPYAASLQKRFDIVRENRVQMYLGKLADQLIPGHRRTSKPSRVFISHDIDDVYGSWIQDLSFACKKFRLGDISRILVSLFLQRPSWLNFGQIMNVKSEYDFKSLFLFIVHKGKNESGLRNADYDIDSPKIRNAMQNIRSRGFEIGIHKSVSSSGFAEELKKLKEPAIANRYHYLRFNWPDAIDELEKSGLAVDSSLGFAEEYGLRNNYTRAFVPYNFRQKRKSTFVEVPLQVMDRTFFGYRKDRVTDVSEQVIRFFEMHKQDSVLSLLWHNNFYTPVKFEGYLAELKKILSYLHEEKIRSISATEIRDTYLN